MDTKLTVSSDLAEFLSKEVCKDLDYSEIYEIAERALSQQFMNLHTVQSLCEEYGERYDYAFLEHQIDPNENASRF